MVDFGEIKKLMSCFRGSFINEHGEFIAHAKANVWFVIDDCQTDFDIKCKVLEWLSRAAHKTEPFGTDRANRRFWLFMQDGINSYLGTRFTHDDFDVIYTYLGNAVNHQKTVDFIKSGYNMSLLEKKKESAHEQ